MNLNVLYEDNHIIVVEKDRGILSQKDITNDIDLLSIVKKYIKEKYNKPNEAFVGLVHRLDRNTSGVMVFAKTSKAASRLFESINNNEFHKSYYAIVDGKLTKEEDITSYLYKDTKQVKSFVTNDQNTGKKAMLHYKSIESINNTTLVKVDLYTGRHHQIRVQMASINHPLYGDSLYGSVNNPPFYLHAFHLSFPHPISKEILTFTTYPSGGLWDLYSPKHLQ